MLAYLVVESRHAHQRESLIDLLWSEQDRKRGNTNFHQTLSHLERAIGNKETNPPFLLISCQTIQWNRESDYWFDVRKLENAVQQASGGTQSSQGMIQRAELETLQKALDNYHGDFLAGFFVADAPNFEEWVTTTREKLYQTVL